MFRSVNELTSGMGKEKKLTFFAAVLYLIVVGINPACGLTCYKCADQSGTGSEGECTPKLVKNVTCEENESCVIMTRYTVDKEVFSVTKGCLANCTNKCEQEVTSKQRCYKCCDEDLCNIKRTTTSPTPTAVVPTNSTETTKKTEGHDHAATRESSAAVLLATFLAYVIGKFWTE